MRRQAKRLRFRSCRATELRSNGGYDDGYSRCACFWGRSPGSLVQRFIAKVPCKGLRVIDLGCGEGKNAYALAHAGALVTAVDCGVAFCSAAKAEPLVTKMTSGARATNSRRRMSELRTNLTEVAALH
jgi:2-polyprenyl-3-methyl-5-hydroxy-6-metoxy-1,4-benzoquinol methylase